MIACREGGDWKGVGIAHAGGRERMCTVEGEEVPPISMLGGTGSSGGGTVAGPEVGVRLGPHKGERTGGHGKRGNDRGFRDMCQVRAPCTGRRGCTG